MKPAFKSVIVATQDSNLFSDFQACVQSRLHADHAPDIASCLEMIRYKRYELIFMDINLLISVSKHRTQDAFKSGLKPFLKIYPTVGIVVITSGDTIRDAVYAVKSGAHNYITYPLNPDEIKFVIDGFYEDTRTKSELNYLRDQFWDPDSRDIVNTRSPLMKQVFEKIRSVSPTQSTVLLYGETGTGKGVISRLIHRHSKLRDHQYISLHCGAIPDTLLESELFGHEKGAFTGANRRKLGKFEIARGGTLFLDEIGTISASAQIKLLQVLQDRTFQRVGGEQSIESDARIIAATNSDLKQMADHGLFRKDLYFRLNVFPIEIPPLKNRKEDIPHIADTIIKRLNLLYAKDIEGINPLVLEGFMDYAWPGNIRELENLIERAYILETSSMLTPESFPAELFSFLQGAARFHGSRCLSLAEVRRIGIENIEREYLKDVLEKNRGKIKPSAAEAGISTRQLHKLMTRYGVRKEDFK